MNLDVLTREHMGGLHQVVVRGTSVLITFWVHGDEAKARAIGEQARAGIDRIMTDVQSQARPQE